ncbi:hypothetical protein SD70_00700 [Gordoniibacillus kamchatkensis]|uniref:Type IV pilus assembly protein PilO n=1 Tax=Gordoniibacillus kamchatkensis TaxID=1590651 RepID=A0ABR5AN64_9BACL|nr:hypothetical protein [Paenibacillus sp. VKM B-2647]KIL42461.1 hypothetical protein SD70_00700 [Paenibacillus sp. VKM B-2647]
MKKMTQLITVYARKPLVIFLLVVCAGVLLNAGLFAGMLLPQLAKRQLLEQQLQMAARQRKTLESQPVQARASAADSERLAKQLPAEDELPAFLVSLSDIEKQSGAKVLNVSIMDGPAANAKAASPPAAASQAQAGAPQAQTATPQAQAANPAIAERQVKLDVDGTYAQLLLFINQLQQIDRITTVRQWQLTSGSGPGAASNPLQIQTLPFKLSLTCSIFKNVLPQNANAGQSGGKP